MKDLKEAAFFGVIVAVTSFFVYTISIADNPDVAHMWPTSKVFLVSGVAGLAAFLIWLVAGTEKFGKMIEKLMR